jgi:hypothetical protein
MEKEKTQLDKPLGEIEPLQTYSSDMADAIRTNEASVIKIALAEQKKREREELFKKAEGSPVKKFFWMLGSIILIFGAVAYSYFLIQEKNTKNAPEQLIKNIETFISYDDQSYIDTTSIVGITDLSESINEEVKKQTALGSIKTLFLTTTNNGIRNFVTSSEFFHQIGAIVPAPLVRSLGEHFMIGSHMPTTANARPHLFLIFGTNDYNTAYAGMLEWEKTMLSDMFVLFKTDISTNRGNLFEKPFKDIILQNKDARILYDITGTDVLYYTFPTKDTFIITDNKETIEEVTTRLLIKKTKPL